MNELRPKLFDVMKGYTREQLIKDIISGIIVAIIALPLPSHLRSHPAWDLNRDFTLPLSPDFLFLSSAEAASRLVDQPQLLL